MKEKLKAIMIKIAAVCTMLADAWEQAERNPDKVGGAIWERSL